MDILNKSEISKLVEVAFVGCMKKQVAQARKIFSYIIEAEPNYQAAKVGLAFTYIVVDDFGTADNLINEILDSDPTNDDARGFLVLSKKLQNDEDSAQAEFCKIIDKNSKGFKMAEQVMELNSEFPR